VPAPKDEEIVNILSTIAKAENFNLPVELAANLSVQSRRNLRRAIMMMQTIKLKNQNLSAKTYVPCPEYESYTKEIAKDVITE